MLLTRIFKILILGTHKTLLCFGQSFLLLSSFSFGFFSNDWPKDDIISQKIVRSSYNLLGEINYKIIAESVDINYTNKEESIGKNLEITLFPESEFAINHLKLSRATINKNTSIVTSQNPVIAESKAFIIYAQGVHFDLLTQEGLLFGKVFVYSKKNATNFFQIEEPKKIGQTKQNNSVKNPSTATPPKSSKQYSYLKLLQFRSLDKLSGQINTQISKFTKNIAYSKNKLTLPPSVPFTTSEITATQAFYFSQKYLVFLGKIQLNDLNYLLTCNENLKLLLTPQKDIKLKLPKEFQPITAEGNALLHKFSPISASSSIKATAHRIHISNQAIFLSKGYPHLESKKMALLAKEEDLWLYANFKGQIITQTGRWKNRIDLK